MHDGAVDNRFEYDDLSDAGDDDLGWGGGDHLMETMMETKLL